MYVPMKSILDKALKDGYAVPAFMTWDETSFRALCEVGSKMNSPIISITPYSYIPDPYLFGLNMKAIAMDYDIPIASCLDHSGTYKEALVGIKNGFTSIMVDRSTLELNDNIEQVEEITKIAHSLGISVEAELGHVGMGDISSKDRLTVPTEAKIFVEKTGVDCLAVAVGTVHGVYKGEPILQYSLIDEISKKIDIPLVLHGGSGLSAEHLKKLAKTAICKVNIANDLLRSSYEACLNADMSGNNIYNFNQIMIGAYKECVERYIKILGSKGKA